VIVVHIPTRQECEVEPAGRQMYAGQTESAKVQPQQSCASGVLRVKREHCIHVWAQLHEIHEPGIGHQRDPRNGIRPAQLAQKGTHQDQIANRVEPHYENTARISHGKIRGSRVTVRAKKRPYKNPGDLRRSEFPRDGEDASDDSSARRARGGQYEPVFQACFLAQTQKLNIASGPSSKAATEQPSWAKLDLMI